MKVTSSYSSAIAIVLPLLQLIICESFVLLGKPTTIVRRGIDIHKTTKEAKRVVIACKNTKGDFVRCRSITSSSTYLFSSTDNNSNSDSKSIDDIAKTIGEEIKELFTCISLPIDTIFKKDDKITVEDVLLICDEIDEWEKKCNPNLFVSSKLQLRRRALEYQRYEMLVKLMKNDYNGKYIPTASFLSPSRIPRKQLPNVQDVPYSATTATSASASIEQEKPKKIPSTAVAPPLEVTLTSEEGLALVADCELEDMKYKDSPLDILLLKIFRKLVEKNTGGVTSDKDGIMGLLEQGRTFMLQPNQTPEAQHKMVRDTLGGLMTPVLPPFYRIFMSGIVPKKLGTPIDGKQFGPWFYAPFLTSFVTPTFFQFLVGPSYVNRRKDGSLGGLNVEKCKFLQESNCKGLCLHQCKLPAQQFFQDELGLSLTVSPNFVTQECQWSFGEEPLKPEDDPSFPKGCLNGCESRKLVLEAATNDISPAYRDLCN